MGLLVNPELHNVLQCTERVRVAGEVACQDYGVTSLNTRVGGRVTKARVGLERCKGAVAYPDGKLCAGLSDDSGCGAVFSVHSLNKGIMATEYSFEIIAR